MLVQTAVNPFIHSAPEDGKATPFRNGVGFYIRQSQRQDEPKLPHICIFACCMPLCFNTCE